MKAAVRALASAVAALVSAASLASCAFQDKTSAGRLIHEAPRLLQRQPGLDLTLAVSARLTSRGTLASMPAPAPPIRFDGSVDLRHGLSFYRLEPSGRPSVVFAGDTIYGLTPGASADDARPWVSVVADKKLSDQRLDSSSVSASLAAAYALRPSLLIDFLDGALTGSIHNVGKATVAGVETTAYTARFDLSQALTNTTRTNYSQRQQDDVAKVLSVLSIDTGNLERGEVWLDAHGLPRQFALTIDETPAPQAHLAVSLLMTLTPLTRTPAIPVPGPDTVITMPSLFQFLTPLTGSVQRS